MAAKKKVSIEEKIKSNPWILSTLIFGIFFAVLAFIMVLGGNVSKNDAANTVLEIAQQQLGDSVTLKSVEAVGDNLYSVILAYNGQESQVYITKDGGELVAGVTPISGLIEKSTEKTPQETAATPEVVKADVPAVELFVMSYCPYGTQSEKGILPIINLLKDKIDFNLRFVYYAMHPTSGEVEENLNQYCIQKEQNDKFLPYLECFLTEGDSEGCLTSTNIDKNKLATCYEAADKEFEITKNLDDTSSWLSGRYPLFNTDKALNEEYGVKGSPTLVINGEQVQPNSRSPAAYLDTICASFTDGNVPEECSQDVSTESLSPGFGWTTSSGATASAQCG